MIFLPQYPSALFISGFKSSSTAQAAPPSPRQRTAAEAEDWSKPPSVRSLLPPTAVVLRVPGPAVVVGGAARVAVVVAAYIYFPGQLHHGWQQSRVVVQAYHCCWSNDSRSLLRKRSSRGSSSDSPGSFRQSERSLRCLRIRDGLGCWCRCWSDCIRCRRRTRSRSRTTGSWSWKAFVLEIALRLCSA